MAEEMKSAKRTILQIMPPDGWCLFVNWRDINEPPDALEGIAWALMNWNDQTYVDLIIYDSDGIFISADEFIESLAEGATAKIGKKK